MRFWKETETLWRNNWY